MDDGLGSGFVGGGAELLIGLDKEELRSGALKVDDGSLADLAAVEAVTAQFAGANAGWRRGGVEQIGRAGVTGVGGEGDLEVELAGFGVPVERQQAGEVLHGGSALSEGLCGSGGLLGSEGRSGKGESDGEGELGMERSSHETL